MPCIYVSVCVCVCVGVFLCVCVYILLYNNCVRDIYCTILSLLSPNYRPYLMQHIFALTVEFKRKIRFEIGNSNN